MLRALLREQTHLQPEARVRLHLLRSDRARDHGNT